MSSHKRKNELKRLHFIADLIAVYRKHGLAIDSNPHESLYIKPFTAEIEQYTKSIKIESRSSEVKPKQQPYAVNAPHANKTLAEYFGERTQCN